MGRGGALGCSLWAVPIPRAACRAVCCAAAVPQLDCAERKIKILTD